MHQKLQIQKYKYKYKHKHKHKYQSEKCEDTRRRIGGRGESANMHPLRMSAPASQFNLSEHNSSWLDCKSSLCAVFTFIHGKKLKMYWLQVIKQCSTQLLHSISQSTTFDDWNGKSIIECLWCFHEKLGDKCTSCRWSCWTCQDHVPWLLTTRYSEELLLSRCNGAVSILLINIYGKTSLYEYPS